MKTLEGLRQRNTDQDNLVKYLEEQNKEITRSLLELGKKIADPNTTIDVEHEQRIVLERMGSTKQEAEKQSMYATNKYCGKYQKGEGANLKSEEAEALKKQLHTSNAKIKELLDKLETQQRDLTAKIKKLVEKNPEGAKTNSTPVTNNVSSPAASSSLNGHTYEHTNGKPNDLGSMEHLQQSSQLSDSSSSEDCNANKNQNDNGFPVSDSDSDELEVSDSVLHDTDLANSSETEIIPDAKVIPAFSMTVEKINAAMHSSSPILNGTSPIVSPIQTDGEGNDASLVVEIVGARLPENKKPAADVVMEKMINSAEAPFGLTSSAPVSPMPSPRKVVTPIFVDAPSSVQKIEASTMTNSNMASPWSSPRNEGLSDSAIDISFSAQDVEDNTITNDSIAATDVETVQEQIATSHEKSKSNSSSPVNNEELSESTQPMVSNFVDYFEVEDEVKLSAALAIELTESTEEITPVILEENLNDTISVNNRSAFTVVSASLNGPSSLSGAIDSLQIEKTAEMVIRNAISDLEQNRKRTYKEVLQSKPEIAEDRGITTPVVDTSSSVQEVNDNVTASSDVTTTAPASVVDVTPSVQEVEAGTITNSDVDSSQASPRKIEMVDSVVDASSNVQKIEGDMSTNSEVDSPKPSPIKIEMADPVVDTSSSVQEVEGGTSTNSEVDSPKPSPRILATADSAIDTSSSLGKVEDNSASSSVVVSSPVPAIDLSVINATNASPITSPEEPSDSKATLATEDRATVEADQSSANDSSPPKINKDEQFLEAVKRLKMLDLSFNPSAQNEVNNIIGKYEQRKLAEEADKLTRPLLASAYLYFNPLSKVAAINLDSRPQLKVARDKFLKDVDALRCDERIGRRRVKLEQKIEALGTDEKMTAKHQKLEKLLAKLKQEQQTQRQHLIDALKATVRLLNGDPAKEHADYMKLANEMQGHKKPWMQRLGVAMLVLGAAIAATLLIVATAGVAIPLALSISALAVSASALVGGGSMFALGRRRGLSKDMYNLDAAARKESVPFSVVHDANKPVEEVEQPSSVAMTASA